jgi:hypothetical protein
MGRCRRGELGRGPGLAVQAVLENGLHALEAHGAEGERAAAGGLQALGPVVACPERIRPRAERKPGCGWARLRKIPSTVAAVAGPVLAAQSMSRCGGDSRVWPMCFGHVLRERGVPSLSREERG